jgi:hypothetical protein
MLKAVIAGQTSGVYLPCFDLDGDGTVTQFDLFAWQDCYRVYLGDPTADPPTGMPGDIDFDDDFDMADVQYYQRCVPLDPALAAPCLDRFDADQNGTTDAADWVVLEPALSGPGR